MVLPLVTPVGSNFIKNFPGQNAINCGLIDTYANASGIAQPLQSFSPLLEATTTNPVLGTGAINHAYFYKIFDQVYMWGEWRWGTSGTNFGSGIYTLALPFSVAALMPVSANFDSSPIVGSGCTFDVASNVGRLNLSVHLRTNAKLQFGVRINSGATNRELRETGYFTFANQCGVSWNARVKSL